MSPSSPTITFGCPVQPVPHHRRSPCWALDREHRLPVGGERPVTTGCLGTGPSPYQLRVAFPRNVVIPSNDVLIGCGDGSGLGDGETDGEAVADGVVEADGGVGLGSARFGSSPSSANTVTASSPATPPTTSDARRMATNGRERDRDA